jgi:hypothetical protein
MANSKAVVKTRDTSTIAVKGGMGALLPVLPTGSVVRVTVGEKSIELTVGMSTPHQLCGVKGSQGSKALHHLLSSAPRVEGLVEVTVEVISTPEPKPLEA